MNLCVFYKQGACIGKIKCPMLDIKGKKRTCHNEGKCGNPKGLPELERPPALISPEDRGSNS